MRSVMSHRFSEVPSADIQRSSFDRSHGHKTTFNGGVLVPIFVDEALPGDTFNLRMHAFARLATPLHPFMDNAHLSTFFFAVPQRLVWENWERFCGSRDDPNSSTDFTIPQIVSGDGGWPVHSLADYFGIPIQVGGLSHSALFHRAYHLIWNEWFRDQNFQDSIDIPLGDGPDPAVSNRAPSRRGKRHDYFTSCLPWPQKGPSVALPLGQEAPVKGIGVRSDNVAALYSSDYYETDGSFFGFGNTPADPVWASANSAFIGVHAPSTGVASEDNAPLIFADLSEATAATVNQLREAFQIQKLYERDARGGTRYVELVKSHFGVTSPDFRLQRPEYLGGGRSLVNVSAVQQTSETTTDSPQGNLAAVATAGVDGHGFSKSFTEHMIVMGIACVDADLTYQRGIPRMFSRSTRWDYYWPALSHLGEQAVLNKEIWAEGNGAGSKDEDVFGYQERWGEYRYKPSQISGYFRSVLSASLDSWHLSEDFTALPELGSAFLQSNPPFDRVIAVTGEPDFIMDMYFDFKCARPMPTYSVPGLIDHF